MKNKSRHHFSEDIHLLHDFIHTNDALSTFLHCTPTEELAQKIMKEGLVFENYLTHTSDPVSGTDLIELNYFRILRKSYGSYTLIIQIEDNLIKSYSSQLIHTPFHFSEVLTKHMPVSSEDDITVYILPEQFIYGYFDHVRKRGLKNPRFDPGYHPPYFDDNLKYLLKRNKKQKNG